MVSTDEQEVGIRATLPVAWEIRFVREQPDGPVPEESPIQVKFNLTLARPHARHLIVALQAIIGGLAWSELIVAYRMAYFIKGEIDDASLRKMLHQLGTHTGPAALYPFVREAVASTTQRAGLSGIALPIMDFARIKWETPIELPEPEAAAPEEFLQPLEKIGQPAATD
jgi:hypothetical protein